MLRAAVRRERAGETVTHTTSYDITGSSNVHLFKRILGLQGPDPRTPDDGLNVTILKRRLMLHVCHLTPLPLTQCVLQGFCGTVCF